MGHVFLRGQVHQKPFGRSPPVQDSATRFYRHRRNADPSPFFKSLLRRRILLRMMRTGLKPGELHFAQPFADRAFRYRDRKAPGHFLAQINTAPAYDLVGLGVGADGNQ